MRHSRPITQFFVALRGTRILIALATISAIWAAIHWKSKPPAPPEPAAIVDSEPALPTEPTEPPAAAEPPKPSVIPLGGSRFKIGQVEFDKAKRTVTIPAAVLMREGAVEYLLVARNGKVHESVFVTDVDPSHVHLAALLLGIQPSSDLGPADASVQVPKPAALQASVQWDKNGPPANIHLHEALAVAPPGEVTATGPAPATLWLYNGSRIRPDGTFVAHQEGSIISVIRDPDALINYPGDTRDNDEIHLPNAPALPKLEHPVRIILKLR